MFIHRGCIQSINQSAWRKKEFSEFFGQTNMDAEKGKSTKYMASDSDDSSDSLEIECDVCDMDFTSVKSYEQHLKSKKHNKMLGKKETKEKLRKFNKFKDNAKYSDDDDDQELEFSCDVCEKAFSEFSQYKAHMKGKGHSKNLKKLKLKEKLKEVEGIVDKFVENEEDDNDELLEKPFAHCTACQKSFSGPENYHQHLRSAAHEKKRKQQALLEKWKKDNIDVKSEDNEEEEYFCEVCGKFFSGPVPYATHMESAVHKKEVKKAKVAEDLKEFYIRDEEDGKFVCKECKRSFNDPVTLKIHLRRNDHEKQKSKSDIMALLSTHPEIVPIKSSEYSDEEEEEASGSSKEVYDFLICKICHLSFNGVSGAQDHVKSKKHLKIKQQRKEIKALKRKLKMMNSNPENGMEFLESHNTDDSEIVSCTGNVTADNALGTLKEE